MGATIKVAQGMANSTFGEDVIFLFCQSGHDFIKVVGES